MNIVANLKTYDDEKVDPAEIRVKSHWNRKGINGLVVIELDGNDYTVSAAELRKAIEACTGIGC